MRLYFLTFCLLALSPSTAKAIDDKSPLTDEEEKQMVDAFVTCAGMYNFTAELLASDSKPESAEYMLGMGRGAKTAAMWILASNYTLKNPSSPPKSLGAWSDYLSPKIEIERTRFASLAEMNDAETIESIRATCLELNSTQSEIVEKIRGQSKPQ